MPFERVSTHTQPTRRGSPSGNLSCLESTQRLLCAPRIYASKTDRRIGERVSMGCTAMGVGQTALSPIHLVNL